MGRRAVPLSSSPVTRNPFLREGRVVYRADWTHKGDDSRQSRWPHQFEPVSRLRLAGLMFSFVMKRRLVVV